LRLNEAWFSAKLSTGIVIILFQKKIKFALIYRLQRPLMSAFIRVGNV